MHMGLGASVGNFEEVAIGDIKSGQTKDSFFNVDTLMEKEAF